MKVEKVVGWIEGQNGTGNLFEVSDNGKHYLAVMYQDDQFYPISDDEVKSHISQGKGKLESNKIFSSLPYGVLNVENRQGWERLYKSTNTETETEISDNLELPFSISVNGTVKINIGGFSKILNLLN